MFRIDVSFKCARQSARERESFSLFLNESVSITDRERSVSDISFEATSRMCEIVINARA